MSGPVTTPPASLQDLSRELDGARERLKSQAEQLALVRKEAECLRKRAAELAGKPELWAALAAAIADAHAVEKDGRHEYFVYATAEAILQVARVPLARHGLALVPERAQVAWSKDGKGGTVTRELRLVHSSGQSVVLETPPWPFEVNRGRPLDKALAGALTGSLRYALRDMLLLPQVDKLEDFNSRQDEEPQRERPQRKGPPPQQQPTESEIIGAERERVKGLLLALPEGNSHRAAGLAFLGSASLEQLKRFAPRVVAELERIEQEPSGNGPTPSPASSGVRAQQGETGGLPSGGPAGARGAGVDTAKAVDPGVGGDAAGGAATPPAAEPAGTDYPMEV